MSQSAARIYQLKITLKGSKPPIWRRVQVASDITLATLHEIMQIVMGWTDSHLHQFKSGNMYYGLPDIDETGDLDEVEDEAAVTLSRVLRRPQAKLLYEYDFGDNWQHDIVLEHILPPEPGRHYSVCLVGKRACPPEDCGGLRGYGGFLEAIQNPTHPEHAETLEWIGGSFDPEAFDMAAVNQALRHVR